MAEIIIKSCRLDWPLFWSQIEKPRKWKYQFFIFSFLHSDRFFWKIRWKSTRTGLKSKKNDVHLLYPIKLVDTCAIIDVSKNRNGRVFSKLSKENISVPITPGENFCRPDGLQRFLERFPVSLKISFSCLSFKVV